MFNFYLTIPGITTEHFGGPPGIDSRKGFDPATITLGGFLSEILPIVFYVAVVLTFIWFVWGALEWIFAGGEKGAITKAQTRIRYALIGLAVTLLALFISNYAQDIIKPLNPPPFPLTTPP